MNFDYSIPTKILFGAGKLNQLAEEALPGKKALIVISNGTSMRKFGYLERVENLLKQQNIEHLALSHPHRSGRRRNSKTGAQNGCG